MSKGEIMRESYTGDGKLFHWIGLLLLLDWSTSTTQAASRSPLLGAGHQAKTTNVTNLSLTQFRVNF